MAKATVTINKESNELVIRMPIEERMSASGKMKLISTTSGNQETETQYDGKPVYANINIGIYATPKGGN